MAKSARSCSLWLSFDSHELNCTPKTVLTIKLGVKSGKNGYNDFSQRNEKMPSGKSGGNAFILISIESYGYFLECFITGDEFEYDQAGN